jgi:hypothetical protein
MCISKLRISQRRAGVGNSWSFVAAETWSPIGAHLAELTLKERSEAARTWVQIIGAALLG